ncbi:MATH and LRR domain-containing protein PFE0570w-like [Nymphalis io]|uniref:MATH and LRR domain-containing protein PFE0570w-like n=1 Tax=Inachis io TaxID=171585 RepID=UPI0021685976|nr:MATH and LRR domain-containing protein PFE0570w-like [Nymphalis io]
MSAFILILIFIVTVCDSLSIGVNRNVTKRDTDVNFFPDWVPFKNKHGDELGEFIDVAKPKPKKRLAPPVNFIMRAVADSEADDYYDKSQGGGDSDDYYEKKEWSDQNRPGQKVDSIKLVNNTNLSDIEGIVNIITKPSDNPVLKALKQGRKSSRRNNDKPKRENEEEFVVKRDSEDSVREVNENKETVSDSKNENEETNSDSKNEDTLQEKSLEKNEEDTEEKDEDDDKIENEDKGKTDDDSEGTGQKEENKEVSKKNDDNESADYDETTMENEKNEPDKNDVEKNEKERENEEKKAKILNSVDELKQRHADEQRSISEKIKEEEMFEEELERELERTGTKRHSNDKYAHPGAKWKKITKDYDDFEDQEPSFKDKYKINQLKTTTTATTTTRTTTSPIKTTKQRRKTNKIEDAKLSVFRNPNLYTVNDDDDYLTTTSRPKKSRIRKPEKFSSKYSDSDNVRISLVPVDTDSKEGEPTLFFPKMRKNKRKFKIKTTTPIPDNTADFSEEKIIDRKNRPASRTDSHTESSPSASDAYSSASNTAPSAETGPSADDSDAAHASTEKKESKKEGNYHRETGGDKEHHSEHDEEHEEHGRKAYEGVHKDTKTNKGHHDKEEHLDKYDDHGGIDKRHHKEDDHYGSHHHEEHGKKHAKYEESGKHSKGHSTKGSHDIHKKDEYEKKVEFFEEEGDMGDEELDGGYHSDKEHSSGGHFKKDDLQAGYEVFAKGDRGDFAKGGHGHNHQGHGSSGGHDSHHKHGNRHFKAEGRDHGKKWVYHHGHPAKTANLVIIDRRADAYQHGPQYYG